MGYDFACPDWFERLKKGESPIADLPIDVDAAEKAVSIFNMLQLPDVIGQPFLGDTSADWMRDIVRAAFGSERIEIRTDENGKETEVLVRDVSEAFILVPKKNGKSTCAAAIALTFMLRNKRKNADMIIIGPTQAISEVSFEQARGMIEADSTNFLSKRFHVQAHKKQIRCRKTNARLMIRTFSTDVVTGSKPIFALIDEIHALGTVPYAADVMRQIRGGMVPAPESLLVMITTQSDHPPAGIFKSELDYARGVRDGRITTRVRMLPMLYEFPEFIQTGDSQDWKNPDLWHLVSPNLGKSVTIDALVDLYERAKQDGHGEVIAWATQHLNVEIGMALHRNRWIGSDFWQAARDATLTGLPELIARSEVAVVGIDGGGADDLLGLNVTGRCRETRQWLSWSKAFCHPVALERRKEIVPVLRDFEAQGDLVICKMPAQDHAEVCDIVLQLLDAGLLPDVAAIGLDPAGVAALVDELAAVGVQPEQMVAVGQGYRLSSAIWGMERKLMDGSYRHGGQPIMAWSISNAKAEQRGNAVLITKETAGKGKIDPLIAAFNAFTLMARNPESSQSANGSYLETEGLMVF